MGPLSVRADRRAVDDTIRAARPDARRAREGATTLRPVVLLFFMVFVTGLARGQERREVPEFQVFGEPASPADAAAIDAVMNEFKDAWANQDVRRLAQIHTRDVEWTNAYARIIRGSDALADFLENVLFPAFDPRVSREEIMGATPVSVRYLGRDAAVVHWYTDSGRGDPRDSDEDARRTHIHFVLGREDGVWRIADEIIMDAR